MYWDNSLWITFLALIWKCSISGLCSIFHSSFIKFNMVSCFHSLFKGFFIHVYGSQYFPKFYFIFKCKDENNSEFITNHNVYLRWHWLMLTGSIHCHSAMFILRTWKGQGKQNIPFFMQMAAFSQPCKEY